MFSSAASVTFLLIPPLRFHRRGWAQTSGMFFGIYPDCSGMSGFGDISCSNVWLLLIIIEQNGSTFVVLILTKNQQKSSAGYVKNSLGTFMGTILTFFWVIHLSKVRLHRSVPLPVRRDVTARVWALWALQPWL